jgi:hypothetical protein
LIIQVNNSETFFCFFQRQAFLGVHHKDPKKYILECLKLVLTPDLFLAMSFTGQGNNGKFNQTKVCDILHMAFKVRFALKEDVLGSYGNLAKQILATEKNRLVKKRIATQRRAAMEQQEQQRLMELDD